MPNTIWGPFEAKLTPEVRDRVKKTRKACWARSRTVPNYPMQEFWRPILDAAGLPEASWEAENKRIKEDGVVFFEVLAVVDRLRRRGYRVGVISNHLCDWFDHAWATFGLRFLWTDPNLVVVSSRAGCAKPSAAIYEHFLAKSGLKAEECVFVDDKEENVVAAEQKGFRGVRFRHRDTDGPEEDSVETLRSRLAAAGVVF